MAIADLKNDMFNCVFVEDDEYTVLAKIYENSDNIDPNEEPNVCDVSFKWDGCTNWNFYGILHTCNGRELLHLHHIMSAALLAATNYFANLKETSDENNVT